jgi:AraC-like DNA-binding protein
MINYFKYLPVSEGDENWGLTVLDVGCGRIAASSAYPHKEHPAHHYFNWKKGRILHEFQLIYITRGKGVFESRQVSQRKITAGTILLLFPGQWHRYKPDTKDGWDEYWIGFMGNQMDQLVKKNFFSSKTPLLSMGVNEKLQSLFVEIIDITKQEKSGFQPLISGILLHLLGNIHFIHRQKDYIGEDIISASVNKAKILLRENIDTVISIEQIAQELQVGYSWFRKIFKNYTGMAPGQYLIQLKIEKSKELLCDPAKSIKEIAYELKFDNNFYFSKLFKEKTGLTPAQFRKKTI